MNQLLQAGQVVNTQPSGLTCEVEDLLGGGGQGEVYRARMADSVVALKWYFPASATEYQRRGLEMLVRKGAPDERFLWPLQLGTAEGLRGYGYVMPLRPSDYKGLVDLVKRRTEPSFRALATAGFQLADSFLQLHARGLCYRDISFGNVFFDPATGDVLICDNDNVTVDHDPTVSIMGTPRFMAPEIVCAEAAPSSQSDLFSLAILMFYMLMIHHPLEGAREVVIHCMDAAAMNMLYGTKALFIFDPADDSNRPVPGVQDNALIYWSLYPKFLRDLFTQVFTEGIRDPINGRVRESVWRPAMVRLRDAIFYCTCGAENFYDSDALQASRGRVGSCWQCHRQLRLPPRLRIGRNIVMLNYDTQLFPHHLDAHRSYDFSSPVAAMTQHPSNPNIWGLKNLSADRWVVTMSDSTTREVEPGRSVMLAAGTKINFGPSDGEVRT